MPAPILLLTNPDDDHPFDTYLEEILRCEGYNCYEKMAGAPGISAESLAGYSLVLVSSGAAHHMDKEAIRAHMQAGGRAAVFKPPRDWGEVFGLARTGETYATARDAYVHVNDLHPWMTGFPAPDLQCLGESHVYTCKDAETLVYIAGQLAYPSRFPAVALKRLGQGVGVMFAYDLAECVVLTHQGRPENASTGSNPDANRDGKFCADDALEGMRDFRLRHVPQADVHQDVLVRVIRGLTADSLPLPRLWHFPDAAPGLFLIDGDGDSMDWSDLLWVVETVERYGVKYTFYLMDQQIDSFSKEAVDGIRARGHDFGPHPWVGLRPTVPEWEREIERMVSRLRAKFELEPRSLRSHCVVFPGWDDSPKIFHRNGLRLDTNFANGYRYVSGYPNGSALPVKFIGRDGEIIDCYEQSTVHTEDGAFSPKTLLPELSEEQAVALSSELVAGAARTYHGVYHPYFHPLSLRQESHKRWFAKILQQAAEANLPNMNAREWLAFNDARRAVSADRLRWAPEQGQLRFRLSAPLPVEQLTVLLPPCAGLAPSSTLIDGEAVELTHLPYEGTGWHAFQTHLSAGSEARVEVNYA